MKAITKRRHSIIFLLLVLSILLALTGCKAKTSSNNEKTEKTEFVLGTVCTITLYGDVSDEAFTKSFERLKEIEARMTINKEGSEVDAVNDASGQKYVKVSDDTFYVISEGKKYSDLSGGLFDISVGPIVKLWNIGTDAARVPAQAEIDEKLKLVGYNNIKLNNEEKSVMLNNKGMLIDLGGIAKGYAADEVKRILLSFNVKNAIINLGGNIMTLGENPEARPWNIGIQNPDASRGDSVGYISVTDKTIVTSGIYERYFEVNNVHYHHMLNPYDGYPFKNNLASVTIVTDKSIIADAFSTSVFAMGIEKGIEYVTKQKDMEAIFITTNNEVYITSGLKDIIKITNMDFKLKN